MIYRPRDAARGNGIALIDVVNRGNKTVISGFNRPGLSADRDARRRSGVCAWVYGRVHRLGVRRAQARRGRSGSKRRSRQAFAAWSARCSRRSAAVEFTVSDLSVYAPLDPAANENTLTVRDARWATASTVPRDAWRLAERTVTLCDGIPTGPLVRAVDAATIHRVGGVGFLSVRDTARLDEAWRDLPSRAIRRRVWLFAERAVPAQLSLRRSQHRRDRDGRRSTGSWLISPAQHGSISIAAGAIPTSLAHIHRDVISVCRHLTTRSDHGQRQRARSTIRALERTSRRSSIRTPTSSTGAAVVVRRSSTPSPDWRAGSRSARERTGVFPHRLAARSGGDSPKPASNGQQKDNPTDYWWVMRALLVAWKLGSRGAPPPTAAIRGSATERS